MSESWDEVLPTVDGETSGPDTDRVRKTAGQHLQDMLAECMAELRLAHEAKYEEEKAVKTAAYFLRAQLELISYISDVELRARQLKRDIERVEAEKYHEYRSAHSDAKKLTEVSLANLIAKDPAVSEAKKEAAEAETDAKRLNYVFGVLRDGHHYFKSIAKSKGQWLE